jgi:hypothetical protein
MTREELRPRREPNVTANDIKCGRIRHATKCPIARAVGRVFRGGKVAITANSATIVINGRTIRYWLPKHVSNFVLAFDAGKTVLPMRFVLDKTCWPTSGAR